MLQLPSSEQTKDTINSSGWKPTDSGHTPRFDYTIEATSLLLNTMQDLTSITPVPLLGEAVAVALRIVSMIQASRNDVKDRNQAFRDLASDAYGLVYTAYLECQNILKRGQRIPDQVEEQLKLLKRNLLEIEEFAQRKVKRGMFKKVIFHAKDIEQINRYRTLLRQSLDVFGIQANISIQRNLDVILKEVRAQALEMERERIRQETARLRAEGERLTASIEKMRLEEKRRTEKRRTERLVPPSQTPKVRKKQSQGEKIGPRPNSSAGHNRTDFKSNVEAHAFTGVSGNSTAGISIQMPFPLLHSHPQYPPPYTPHPWFGGASTFPYTRSEGAPSLHNVSGSDSGSAIGTPLTVHWNYNSGNVTSTIIQNVGNDYTTR
ncbi:hypothetical protein D9613_004580 [Agrocybe pediades]|uniref:Uncharacterized protein n=1 Tax=Agrocybe pediades TaxID=84607 RepID=A0A8H4QK36_9AGAR|nr:hypothetical protein D9613_004580 [Agrocybe pediades]